MRALLAVVALLALAAGAWFARGWWLPTAPQLTQTPPEQRTPEIARTPPASPTESGSTRTETGSSPAETGSTRTGDVDAQRRAQAETEAAVRVEAERYIETLTEPETEPVKVERADHFMTSAQMISLVPQSAIESTTITRMRADPTLGPDTPITVVRESEQLERVTPERLIARSGGDLDMPIKVLDRDQVRETTVREVLEQARLEPQRPIDLITRSDYYEQTTPAELAARAANQPDEPIRLIRNHHGVEASTISALLRGEGVDEDSLFYVRTVRPQDSKGIWGIVHSGIIDNFARGMAIRRGQEINVYQVDIPLHADQRLDDRSSSYLGKLIHDKTRASHVYNFNLSRMGRNPDRIYPGQEIVIIDFRAEELIEIYQHFVAQRG